ncbi:T9SS type A sorting domain-containing protein [candidate division KSB1 bacterium]|nr:T9SS type A sorting domain-containing protein [candidate division KSB1 bacterium]
MKKTGLLLLCLVLFFSISVLAQDPIDPNTQKEGRNGIYADFEDDTIDDLGEITWEAFDCDNAATIEVVNNPDATGVNTSAKVGKFTTTSCTNEGAFVQQEYVAMNMIRNYFKVDVYAPAADCKVVFRLEKFDNAEIKAESTAMTTVANQWETLVFDFTGAESGVFGKIIIMPDFEGTNEEVWYFDNIWQYRDPILYKDGLLANFEDINPWWHFWDCDDGSAEFYVVENPLPDDVNSSEMCAWMYTSVCPWEGFANDEKYMPFEWVDKIVFKLKVLAPDAGLSVLFKLENFEDKNINKTVEMYTESGSSWEELSFDFTNVDGMEQGMFGRIAIFPDFNTDFEDDWFMDDIRIEGHTTAVDKEINPVSYNLRVQNYPNPFNPQTTISYTLPKATNVKLVVYDIQGKEVAVLVNENKSAGSYNVLFDGADFASGVYFYKLATDYRTVTNKMLLVK